MDTVTTRVRVLEWRDDSLWLIDQRELPTHEVWIAHQEPHQVVESINTMVVRGAPAIGIAAAYGVVLALRQGYWGDSLREQIAIMAQARPTAINLHWALQQIITSIATQDSAASAYEVALAKAHEILLQEQQANLRMGQLGAAVMAQANHNQQNLGVLTHCNAGALATGGIGTALGVIRTGWKRKVVHRIYAGETRPWMQGARLTAWELLQDDIPVTLVADSVGATLMAQGKVQWLVVGADRVVANGDVANKIGTYSLAVLARYHGVKVMVVAPCSTLDFSIQEGAQIPIENRAADELTQIAGKRLTAENVGVFNPVFDVTPAALIDVLVSEKGVIEKPNRESLAQWR